VHVHPPAVMRMYSNAELLKLSDRPMSTLKWTTRSPTHRIFRLSVDLSRWMGDSWDGFRRPRRLLSTATSEEDRKFVVYALARRVGDARLDVQNSSMTFA
jgi:hypothetical protein